MKSGSNFLLLRQCCWLVLIMLFVSIGQFAASGQATPATNTANQSARPGARDPLGKPSRYTILSSHELLTIAPNGPREYLATSWAADKNLTLTPSYDSYSYPSEPEQIFASSGRILAPGLDRRDKYDQVIFAKRSGSNVAVNFYGPPALAPTLLIPGLADRVQNSADFLDVAVADLDKLPDASGNNHDEVVVVYAASDAGNQLTINLQVLDYTSDADNPYPAPVAVTSAATRHAVNGNNFAHTKAPGSAQTAMLPVDNVLAVASGDFDGDGQNEIAVLALENAQTAWLTLFRYTNDGAGSRALRQLGEISYSDSAGNFFANAASVDLVAGDFNGDGRDELAAVNVIWVGDHSNASNILQYVFLRTFQSDTQFKLTAASSLRLNDSLSAPFAELGSRVRAQLAAGLFRFEPDKNFGLARRQLALAWNRPLTIGGSLELDLFTINDKLSLEGALSGLLALPLAARQRFALAAGAFRGNDNLDQAVWALAVGTLSETGRYEISMLRVEAGAPALSSQRFAGAGLPDVTTRLPIVPYDERGKALRLGAPMHLTADNIITTDFVIQEPPKHAFYDNRQIIGGQPNPNFGKVVNVSRDDAFHIELIDEQKNTFSSKSTDTSSKNIGVAGGLTAKASLEGGIGGIKAYGSVEVAAKIGYDYEENKKSYNANYSERSLSYGGQTNREDYLAGRLQLFDIWRYRIYGVPGESGDQASNAFYDLVLPGPAISFQGGASSFDWYQPVHENGNVLSYPRPTGNFFTPADLGSYRLPCVDRVDAACVPCDLATDKSCGRYGTRIISEPLIPASRQAWTGNQSFIALKYSDTATAGSERTTDKTLSESVDVKVTVGAKARSLFVSGSVETTVEVEQHGKFSWGTAVTSESSSTHATGITLRTSQGNANQGYPFFPVFYATQDGTIKAAHAVDVLGGSAQQRQFWSAIYGGKPDPALNLPGRFQPHGPDAKQQWVANPYLTRKTIRGFFLRHAELNPITGEYGYLAEAPLLGDRVRLEARLYNYSTGRAAEGLKVRWQMVRLDESTYAEIDPRTNQPLDDAYLQLHPSLRTTLGETWVGTLNPLDWTTASLVWDSQVAPPPGAGTIPAGAAQLYRVYVVLDPDDAINEIYDTELPGQFDPGQNNEGYSDISVMRAPALAAGAIKAVDAQLRGESLAAFETVARNGKASVYKTGQVRAFLNQPLRLRVRVFSDHSDSDLSPLLVYDGDPEQGGRVIAGKFVPSGDAVDGAASFFEWTPGTLGAHTLYARLLTDHDDPNPANNTAQLLVNVVPFDTIAPGIEVTLTPTVLWPADGRMVRVAAHIRVRDDQDPNPVIKLESITASENRRGLIDIGAALFGTDDRQFLLRAQNLTATGPARVYTATYSATDWAGNKTFYSTTISVRR